MLVRCGYHAVPWTAAIGFSGMNSNDILMVEERSDQRLLNLLASSSKEDKPSVMILHSARLDELVDLTERYPWVCHFIGQSQIAQDLYFASQVHMASGRMPPVSALLSPSSNLHLDVLKRYESGGEDLKDLERQAGQIKRFPDFATRVSSAAHELVANACFDSYQKDSSTIQAYPRTGLIDLPKKHWLQLEYGQDQDHFVVSVTDQAGTLQKDHVISNLMRCRKKQTNQVLRSPSGSGVGIYSVLDFVSRLDFVVVPGVMTRVSFVLCINQSPKSLDGQPKSINFLIGSSNGG